MYRNHTDASRCGLIAALLILLIPALAVGMPDTVAYQGFLANSAGAAVSDTVTVHARLYDATGTVLLYHEEHPNVDVDAGLFRIEIGSGAPVSGTFGAALFMGPTAAAELELQINGEVLSPRRPFLSTAYSQAAADSELLAGRQWFDFVVKDHTGTQSVSDGALTIDGASGNVTTVGEYRYAAPKTYRYSITADRFIATNSNEWQLAGIFYRYSTNPGSIRAVAGYNLPEGARQTRLYCHFTDSNTFGSITFLRAQSLSRNPGETTLVGYGQLSTDSLVPASSVSLRTRSVALINTPVPAGAPLQIEMTWEVSAGGSSLLFYGCDVEYTLDRVSF